MSNSSAMTAQRGGMPEAQPRDMKLEFRGSGKEYFRVWIVNLCLTLLTLGLFSAWAKVRKKRYFYSHTVLDGTPFQYLGQPLPILKGRIVAAIVFIIYYFSSHFFIPALPYIAIVGLIVAPWVIVRSAAFNARYSAYRNMTFSFDASYFDAAKTFYAFGLIPVVILGIMMKSNSGLVVIGSAMLILSLSFPWWLRRMKQFIVRHTSYGGENGEMHATTGQFYKVYFKAGLIMMGLGLVLAAAFGLLAFMRTSGISVIVSLVLAYGGYAFSFAYIQAHIGNTVWSSTRLGPLQFQSTLRARELLTLYITNLLGILCSFGLLIPWAVIRTFKYRTERLQVQVDGDLGDFRGGDTSAVQATGAEIGEFFELDLSL